MPEAGIIARAPGADRRDRPPDGSPGTAARPRTEAPRYAVLGLGNLIQGDEALGGRVVALLHDQPDAFGRLPMPDAVELIDGGTVGLGLVPYLVGLDGLIVVDIIDGGAEPGTPIDLDGQSVVMHEPVMGVHDLGAEELLGALLFMDALPRRVRVVGIQPVAITLGTELSPVVAAAVPGLVATIAGHLATWQLEDETPVEG
jgi:hydrogenase maturation protease